jgi:hypothetical protein
MAELTDYIKKVSQNQTLYDSYFEWKKKPLPKAFLDLMKKSIGYTNCRTCERFYFKFNQKILAIKRKYL